MAQHDYVIANQSGSAFRADLNNALAASVSTNSGSSAPSTTYAYMLWADTTNGVLKIRNSANNAWIELLQLDGTLTMEDGAEATPGLAFRDDLNTGIWSSAADTFNISTGGTERLELGAATVFNESGADVDFRIEGDTEANLFHVNAGSNSIGIRTDSPDRLFTVNASATTRMNIKSGSSSTAGIEFGDSDDFNAGYIVYDNGDNSFGIGTNGTGEKFSIKSDGHVKINDGDLIIGTAGHGIDFSATADGSGASNVSEILDDYEKGTFTPSISSTCRSGTITYGNAVGFYTKIGNRVFAQFYMYMSGGTNNANQFIVDGLPFSCVNTASHEGGGYHTYMGGFFTAEADRVNKPWVGLAANYVKFHKNDGSALAGNDTSTSANYLIFHVQFEAA